MIARAIVFASVFGLIGTVSVARAQTDEPFSVDGVLAEQGARAWKSKSCDGCHTIGKGKRAGPDLAGVVERRSVPWLTDWLKRTTEMAKSDPVAKQMVKEASGFVMPDMSLSDAQVQGLIHYMARESKK